MILTDVKTDLLIFGVYIFIGWIAALGYSRWQNVKPTTKSEWRNRLWLMLLVAILWPGLIIVSAIGEAFRLLFGEVRAALEEYHRLPK
jgi:polyferredoxin